MLRYILRRLWWMIPTFFGIVLINFVMLRVGAPNLADALAGGAGEAGVRDVKLAAQNVESQLALFRVTGLDLPALVNLRGFSDKDDAVSWLRAGERGQNRSLYESNRAEKDLWSQGRFLVGPLAEVIADDALAELHGPASMAFSLCAYQPLNRDEVDRMSAEAVRARQNRNADLEKMRIVYRNDAAGYVTDDPRSAEKRARIAAFWQQHGAHFSGGAGSRWQAILGETGFADFIGKLATGRLYSHDRKEYVFTLIGERWQTTFLLNLAALIISWGGAIALGIRAARRQGTLEEAGTSNVLFALWSLPPFFIGTVFLHHLCTDSETQRALFPNLGLPPDDTVWLTTPDYLLNLLWHITLPLVVLTYASFASLSRYMRGSLLEQFGADYVRTARAKGCDEDRVVYGHALRNSLITMITLGGGLLAELFSSSFIVERIFSIPGLGTLTIEAAIARDMPVVMGGTIISVGLLLLGILVTDLLYAVVDPRLRGKYA